MKKRTIRTPQWSAQLVPIIPLIVHTRELMPNNGLCAEKVASFVGIDADKFE